MRNEPAVLAWSECVHLNSQSLACQLKLSLRKFFWSLHFRVCANKCINNENLIKTRTSKKATLKTRCSVRWANPDSPDGSIALPVRVKTPNPIVGEDLWIMVIRKIKRKPNRWWEMILSPFASVVDIIIVPILVWFTNKILSVSEVLATLCKSIQTKKSANN